MLSWICLEHTDKRRQEMYYRVATRVDAAPPLRGKTKDWHPLRWQQHNFSVRECSIHRQRCGVHQTVREKCRRRIAPLVSYSRGIATVTSRSYQRRCASFGDTGGKLVRCARTQRQRHHERRNKKTVCKNISLPSSTSYAQAFDSMG